ncbi:hypothetical protein KY290_017285 [Solanum tuberosum]|uniref:Uncharacterized protein n=1 Tax=Solanum tuberosum TaxID=4113 RepID=A0ABQ7VD46_SOLTU|nr:hypothetical protein KY290_017285 [Solanum tuberosum]
MSPLLLQAQSPPPSSHSPSPSPHRVREKATLTADIEILGVYGSSASIHSINAPPRKRGNTLNVGDGTFEVRAKSPNVDTFSCAAPKASTLGLLARTTDVPSPSFNMIPLFLGGVLTEWMRALLP